MAFDLDNFDKLSAAGLPQVRKMYSYVSSTDNLATIQGSGYFNSVADRLTIGDQIYLKGSDGVDDVNVTAVSPNVTVAIDPGSAPGSITNTEIASNAAIAFSKLEAMTAGNILVGSAGNVATEVTMSGDATMADTGALTIANDAVTTAKIANANVTLAKLASGITPSHVIKFAGQHTTVGSSAAEAITVTGAAAATDYAFVQLVNDGTNNVSVLNAVVTNDTLTVTFSADPGNDAVINYQIIRAAS